MGRSLNSCKRELDSIINEIESIQSGVRNSFDGIGEDTCAQCIGYVLSRCREVKRQLRNVDMNRLAEWVLDD